MLNLDLSMHNPVQFDSQYANIPFPSAHLVVIEESEIKDSVKDGFNKGTNIVFEMTILASSTGNDFVGEKIPLYIPYQGFEENAIKAGMKRLSTLAHTLGIGAILQNKEDLHGQNFIIVVEKSKNNNFPNFKRILNAQGMEIADASGNFKPCELKDTALATELEKLLAVLNGGGVQQPQQQVAQQPQGFVAQQQQQPAQTQQAPATFAPQNNAPAQQQSFTPPFAGGVQNAQAQQPTQQVQQQPNFGGNAPVGNWGQAVNPSNGQ